MQESSTSYKHTPEEKRIPEEAVVVGKILLFIVFYACLFAALTSCQDGGLQHANCPTISRPCFVNSPTAKIHFNEQGVEFAQGACKSGTSFCNPMDGVFGACSGFVAQTQETCDEVDNDCDGFIDNLEKDTGSICIAGVGDCSVGYWSCADGTPICIGVGRPSEETCDGRDNNCNGDIDEGIVRPCYSGPQNSLGVGVCAPGYSICYDGKWTACLGEIVPSPEVPCNAEDEDCDGTSSAVSQCDCNAGLTPEVCDGLDNNCDGHVDEGVTNACGGCGPTEEIPCNGIDDDCDGEIDEEGPAALHVSLLADQSGSMREDRLASIREGLSSALDYLNLSCSCNLYTVAGFPANNAEWETYATDVLAPAAKNATLNFGIAASSSFDEYSYDIVIALAAQDGLVVMFADEPGQTRHGRTENSVATAITAKNAKTLVFSDVPEDYDAIGSVTYLDVNIAEVVVDFVGRACAPAGP